MLTTDHDQLQLTITAVKELLETAAPQEWNVYKAALNTLEEARKVQGAPQLRAAAEKAMVWADRNLQKAAPQVHEVWTTVYKMSDQVGF